ncbi:MAG: toxic anion resistance protein [Clostridiales bacterium]|nr:toxic anion resistance protein [Clostridiales bacterium]
MPTLVLPGEEEEKTPETAPAASAAAAVQAAPAPEAAPVAAQTIEPVDAKDDSLNFDNLTPEEQAAVLAFVERIDIHNSETVLKYGNAAQTKISQFSDKILEDVKTKDTGAISDMLTNLVAELKGFDVDEGKKGGFLGLFKKAGNSITQLRAKYDKVEENVAQIILSLQNHQKQLISDCKMLDELYAQNEQYYHELTLYIIAGEIKLKKLREEELPPMLAKAQQTADPADAQAANDFSQLIERFEKRIHDLKLTRMVSVQMGPQIRLMQNNDNVLAERIQSTIANTIPLWKSQMVIAMGMQHAESALNAQKSVTDMTNELLRSNAERLKMGTIETAKEAERGVVDIETIRTANTALIDTLTEVQKIQREGAQKRAAASIELGRLEKELRDKILEVNN